VSHIIRYKKTLAYFVRALMAKNNMCGYIIKYDNFFATRNALAYSPWHKQWFVHFFSGCGVTLNVSLTTDSTGRILNDL
jgi:hypothetical protein